MANFLKTAFLKTVFLNTAVTAVLASSVCLASPWAVAQSNKTGGSIYTCVDASGRKHTSDRPIPECQTREQRMLNSDGSVKGVVGPPMTADERAAAEARDQALITERANRQEAIRRDRNLLARFPNEAAHRKARAAALDDVRKSLVVSENRLNLLANERKPLQDEAEFYVGKRMPTKLKTQLDANDATVEAQRALVQNLRVESVRIEQLFDAEFERLKKLWEGAQPGSMGTLAETSQAKVPRSAPGKPKPKAQ
jgi:Domain of unknown function (DUF4124)